VFQRLGLATAASPSCLPPPKTRQQPLILTTTEIPMKVRFATIKHVTKF
jgi:hypothetical protein